jgi:hypothetical protein
MLLTPPVPCGELLRHGSEFVIGFPYLGLRVTGWGRGGTVRRAISLAGLGGGSSGIASDTHEQKTPLLIRISLHEVLRTED